MKTDKSATKFLILKGTKPVPATKEEYEIFQASEKQKEIEQRVAVKGSKDEVSLSFSGNWSFRDDYAGKPFFVIYYESGSIVEWNSVTEELFATYEEALSRFNELAKIKEKKAA
ncbi:MAG TPA: hypothetical protein VJY62_04910 [Bacteroidia bacterium]|nr:hypothetical protein [Bacteroidia bacterium]